MAASEKAARERIRKRGPHRPPTCDAILLRLNAVQKARCTDQASVNMESNARLRDSWGPHDGLQDPPRPNPWQEVPPQVRKVSTAPRTRRPIGRVGGLSKSATVRSQAPDWTRRSSPECCRRSSTCLPKINPAGGVLGPCRSTKTRSFPPSHF